MDFLEVASVGALSPPISMTAPEDVEEMLLNPSFLPSDVEQDSTFSLATFDGGENKKFMFDCSFSLQSPKYLMDKIQW